MKQITLFGAGLSATSLINYLLKHAPQNQWTLTIADKDIGTAKEKVKGHPSAVVTEFDINDEKLMEQLIIQADVVISFMPARFHMIIAKSCVAHKKHMVTASYVSKEMKALDQEAKEAGILLLNEIGVDPGIDHMSAMKVIDEIRAKGGVVESFKSSTGGLVAPAYDTNPWSYKFTWNPRNVVLAGQGVSQFIRNGRYKYIPYTKLFQRVEKTEVLDVGTFEIYPNRDSLSYRATYGLEDIPTIFRGTMRRPGFCEAWDVFAQLGITDDTYIMEESQNMTYRQFVNAFLHYSLDESVESKLAKYCDIEEDGEIMQKIKWLGLLEDRNVGLVRATPAQILQKILVEKWALDEGDKDMIVMQHKFVYSLNEKRKEITSSMVVYGNDEDTAMSITVGTPVAIAVRRFLLGEITQTGVHTPVIPEIYLPILKELEEYNISFVEEEHEI